MNVFMADDDSGFLRAYTKFFEKSPHVDLVGVADSGTGLVERLVDLEPDLLLLDVEMPGMSGVDVVRRLQGCSLPTKVVMLTSFDRDEYVQEALRYGASGFLLKNASPAQILSGIRAVHAGQASLAMEVKARLVDHFAGGGRTDRAEQTGTGDDTPAFTFQQREICRLLAAGYRSQDIADELHLSNETVRTYLRRMFDKFGVKNRTQLVVLAYRAGVLR
ncbi:response regulator [Nocardiopsis halophila]|uniref:response regulator n=1 Tax=Nocardiopsis halophila TaxID=141692 RepID=UPI001F4CBE2A|nr:response regulator transcription factor [Nocardiopsis halophila]